MQDNLCKLTGLHCEEYNENDIYDEIVENVSVV